MIKGIGGRGSQTPTQYLSVVFVMPTFEKKDNPLNFFMRKNIIVVPYYFRSPDTDVSLRALKSLI
jgi:hypothetical protein